VPAEDDIPGMARQMFVQASFRRYVSYLLMLHDANNHADWFDVEGWERVEQALEKKKGVVLLSSHVGLSRAERWFLRTKPYAVLHVLRIGFAKESDQSWTARFQRWHQGRYKQDSDSLIGNEELSIQYMKKAYEHLRRNGIVTIAGDGSSGERRYPVTIAGRRHVFAAGGISLGLLSGAEILPCFTSCDATPRFRIVFEEALALPPATERTAATQALVEAYAARIEAFVLRHPANVVRPRYSLQLSA
jgi:lauroyl/myristoyl acyltransferase